MRPPRPSDLEKASQAWLVAARELRITVVAPFLLTRANESAQCLAFLPDFGGPKGMVIGAILGPGFQTDKKLTRLARAKGLFCSFINPVAYGAPGLDRAVFVDILEDCGYFGPLETCPAWYGGYNYTQIAITRAKMLEAWAQASLSLEVRVVRRFPPFTDRNTFIAVLPDFGGPKGMILGAVFPPKFDKDDRIQELANRKEMFCAFLRGVDYAAFRETEFRRALKAWRYFGPPERRPPWLGEPVRKKH